MPKRRAVAVALDGFILVCALAITGFGIAVLIASQRDTYLSAPRCAQVSQALTEKCYVRVDVTVTSGEIIRHGRLGPQQPVIRVHWDQSVPADFTVIVPQPTQAFYDLQAGGHASLKVWNGVPTAIYTLNGAGVRTSFNPISSDEVGLWGGITLLGVGLVLLIVHPLTTRWLAARGHAPPVSHGSIFSGLQLRVALVALIALQFLDIVSSILGGRTGLYESNPVAAQMVEAWGPLGGFLALKLPALIAILLAMTRLPHRVALLLAWAGCAVMLWVVVNNIGLVVQGQAAR